GVPDASRSPCDQMAEGSRRLLSPRRSLRPRPRLPPRLHPALRPQPRPRRCPCPPPRARKECPRPRRRRGPPGCPRGRTRATRLRPPAREARLVPARVRSEVFREYLGGEQVLAFELVHGVAPANENGRGPEIGGVPAYLAAQRIYFSYRP